MLLLDSYESIEPELARSVRALIERDDTGAVGARMNRRVWYRGKPLMHAFQPEMRVRLARREKMSVGGYDPHDRIDVACDSGERVETIGGDIRHDSFESIARHLSTQARHARDAAASLHAMGRTSSPLRVLTAAQIELFKQVVVKGAWRDGVPGWLCAGSMAAYALMKHACLLELSHINDTETQSDLTTTTETKAETDTRTTASDRQSITDRPTTGQPITDPADRQRTRGRDQHPSGHRSAAGAAASVLPARDEQPVSTTMNRDSMNEDSTNEAGTSGAGAEIVEPKPETSAGGPDAESAVGSAPKKKRRRRRGRGAAAAGDVKTAESPEPLDDDDARPEDEPRRKRGITAVKPISDEAKEHVFDTARGFKDLGLKEELLETLAEAGWENPTKIQSELIPVAMTGKDVLGQAKTGSGKTAAFGLPLLHAAERGVGFQALVLAPTRELALQIRDDMEGLGHRTGLKICPVYGGQKILTQAKRLEQEPEIIVGTPGRIMDMNARGLLPLDRVRFAVLDEVDRMFDIGFRDDIKRILGLCNRDRQTIFVSATLSDEIERLARKHMDEPERLTVTSGSLTVEMVQQHHIPVAPWDKKRMLAHVLTSEDPDLTIVFCRMKRTVDDLVKHLSGKGIEAHALHGDMSQGKRNQTMKNFRHGTLNVLVASDLAARGLDVEGITHVVNYDLPEDPDLYVHRIGRTARAGRDGIAWSLVTPEQGSLLTQIENLINAEIPKKEYDNFDARDEPPKGYRPEPKPGGRPQYIVEGVGEKASRNRYDTTPTVPPAEKLSEAALAKKFPGGIVPKKPPKKSIRGRVRTARGNRDAD
ncbi:MAG: DEAD/DEAH box helicase [Planctomycetota bacterium]